MPKPCAPTAGAPRQLSDLRGPERRLVGMLRHWALGPDGACTVWTDLAADLGPARARACLSAFEDVLALIRRSAWRMPDLGAPGDDAVTADEDGICRLVMAATESDRDEAMMHALFLVREDALLPLVLASSRLGLPLLCAECRARLVAARRH